MANTVDAIIKVKRGTEAQRKLVTFAAGELAYSVDTQRLFVGDGGVGGNPTSSRTYLGSVTPTYAISGDFYVDTALTRLYVLTGTECDKLSAYGLVADGGAINDMYNTINTNSGSWGLTGASFDSYTTLAAYSGFWQDTYENVSVLSATWNAGGGGGSFPDQFDINSIVKSGSGTWFSTSTTVTDNSANWNNINTTYATVNSLSTSWSNILSSATVQTYSNAVTATGNFLVFNLNGVNQAIRLWNV